MKDIDYYKNKIVELDKKEEVKEETLKDKFIEMFGRFGEQNNNERETKAFDGFMLVDKYGKKSIVKGFGDEVLLLDCIDKDLNIDRSKIPEMYSDLGLTFDGIEKLIGKFKLENTLEDKEVKSKKMKI